MILKVWSWTDCLWISLIVFFFFFYNTNARTLSLEILLSRSDARPWVFIFFNMVPGVSDMQADLENTSQGPRLWIIMLLGAPLFPLPGCRHDRQWITLPSGSKHAGESNPAFIWIFYKNNKMIFPWSIKRRDSLLVSSLLNIPWPLKE